jgi:hypothetical protein
MPVEPPVTISETPLPVDAPASIALPDGRVLFLRGSVDVGMSGKSYRRLEYHGPAGLRVWPVIGAEGVSAVRVYAVETAADEETRRMIGALFFPGEVAELPALGGRPGHVLRSPLAVSYVTEAPVSVPRRQQSA